MKDVIIDVPDWWSVMHLEKSFDNPLVVGWDTETVDGLPYTQQFYSEDTEKKLDVCLFTTAVNVTRDFLRQLNRIDGKRIVVICYYAKFDIPVVFFPYIREFAGDSAELNLYGWEITIFCAKNWWASLYHKPTGKYVQIIDAFNFFKGGLDKVATSFKLPVRKIARPKRIGEYAFSRKNTTYIQYAKRDARVAYLLGKIIVEQHREYDIPVSLSAPKMAELVFRKKFLQPGDEYLLPTDKLCLDWSLLSYHGAKNAYYLDHPAFFRRVYDYDIISAYPYAMSILPSFLAGEYVKVNRFVRDVLNYPGIYYVEGELAPCRYGVFASPHFSYVRKGGFIKTFVTCYELLEALRSKEFRMQRVSGFIFRSKAQRNPLREYVEHFFRQKEQSKKGSVQYEFYKLLLNSLYGKWIQTNPAEPQTVEVGEGMQMQLLPLRKVAAGLFNPFIASLITGFIRAELHRLEHKYRAIDTSTDSFKTESQIHISRAMKRLGGLELKFRGNALFCRNRLNLLLNGNLIKGYALHGFQGTPQDLYHLYVSRTTEYAVERMALVRESFRQKDKQPFRMYQEVRSLNVQWGRLRRYA